MPWKSRAKDATRPVGPIRTGWKPLPRPIPPWGSSKGRWGGQTKALAILEESALPVQKKRLDLYKAHKSYRLGK